VPGLGGVQGKTLALKDQVDWNGPTISATSRAPETGTLSSAAPKGAIDSVEFAISLKPNHAEMDLDLRAADPEGHTLLRQHLLRECFNAW